MPAGGAGSSPAYAGSIHTNSNSNSYNPHATENYDSYKKRGEPGYGSSAGFSRNPYASPPGQPTYQNGSGEGSLPNNGGGLPNGHNGMSPPQQNGMPNGGHQNGIPTQQNGMSPPQNGMSPPQNGMSPPQSGMTPPQQNGMNGYASTGKPVPPSSNGQDKYR